jgi:hypothetical protein
MALHKKEALCVQLGNRSSLGYCYGKESLCPFRQIE